MLTASRDVTELKTSFTLCVAPWPIHLSTRISTVCMATSKLRIFQAAEGMSMGVLGIPQLALVSRFGHADCSSIICSTTIVAVVICAANLNKDPLSISGTQDLIHCISMIRSNQVISSVKVGSSATHHHSNHFLKHSHCANINLIPSSQSNKTHMALWLNYLSAKFFRLFVTFYTNNSDNLFLYGLNYR